MRRYETKGGESVRTALKIFRIRTHCTQAEFATRCEVSRATYAFIERGERNGTAAFWAKLQRAFDVPDEEMYKLMKIDEVTA